MEPEGRDVLHLFRGLTEEERTQVKLDADAQIKRNAGTRPERNQFEREYGSQWNILDILAGLVGISAWAISSAHVWNHAGAQAIASFTGLAIDSTDPLAMTGGLYGIIHRFGFIILAESAMLLFMVMHTSRHRLRPQADDEHVVLYLLRTKVSIPLLLGLLAAVFIFVANWHSGIGLLESILPPIITVGLGVYFEGRFAESVRRREEVTRRHHAALDDWERLSGATRHSHEWRNLYARMLLDRIKAVNATGRSARAKQVREIMGQLTKEEKNLLVHRELGEERWFEENPTLPDLSGLREPSQISSENSGED